MSPNLTGSLDDLVSSIHFMKNGEILASDVNEKGLTDEEIASLLYTQEYFFYALERKDWFLEFIKLANTTPKKQDPPQPKLVLLQGGLSETEEDC